MIDLTKFNTISFALDGVLIDEFNGEPNHQKEEMQNLLKECIKLGKKVSIFSRRYSPDTEAYPYMGYAKKAKKLIKVHKKENKIADKIFKEIIGDAAIGITYTSRNPSYGYMRGNLDNHCHFDCSDYEISLMKTVYGNHIITFNINKDNWKEYEHAGTI